jgi:hypothetical protein
MTSNDPTRPAQASRWRRRGVVAIVVILLLLMVRVALDLWFGHELNVAVARLEKVYGPMDLRSMAPATVPPQENRARVVRAAASLTSITQWGKLDAFIKAVPGQTNAGTRQDVAREVEQNRLALQLASEVRNRSRSNWEIDYPETYRMPRVVEIRAFSDLLAAAGRFDVDAGLFDEASRKTACGLRTASSLASEPVTLIQLMRVQTAADHIRTAKQMLAAGAPSGDVLEDLAQALAESRTPDPVRTALLSEMKWMNWVMTRGDASAGRIFFTGEPDASRTTVADWVFRPLSRMTHLYYLRTMEQLLQQELTPPFARKHPIVLPPARPPWWQIRTFLNATFVHGAHGIAEAGYNFQSALNVAELAVALRRYRMDSGAYPASLDQLAPRYLSRVPVDPFTGRPPDYQLAGSGFTLTGHGAKDMSWSNRQLVEWTIDR